MEPRTPAFRASTRAARAARLGAAVVALAAALAVALAYDPSAGAQGAVARLTPSVQAVAPDGVVTVTLSVAGVTDLAAFQAGIDWDDLRVAVEEVVPTDWIGTTGRRIEMLPPKVTNHTLDFLVFTSPQAPGQTMPGVGGAGDLAAVRFRAVSPGRAVVTLRQLNLANTANTPIAADLESAEFEILEPTPVPQPHIYLPYANRSR